MKLLVLFLCSLFIQSVFAHESRSSTVTINGKAAAFLLTQVGNENLSFVRCVESQRSTDLGVVQCVLDVYTAEENESGLVRISGHAARELYGLETGDPEESGIDCFIKRLRSGGTEVGCDLEAHVVACEGL